MPPSEYVSAADNGLAFDEGRKAAAPDHGLPAPLPRGEYVVWQGAPRWLAFVRQVFKAQLIALYFAVLAVWRAAMAVNEGLQAADAIVAVLTVLAGGAVAIGLLAGLAWFAVRSTKYTITNRRVVMRIGAALTKTIDIPFKAIASVQVKAGSNGVGNIALKLRDGPVIPYLIMWPHVRPWRLRHPEPMLRAVPDIEAVSRALGSFLKAAARDDVDNDAATDEPPAPAPGKPVQHMPRVPLLGAAGLAVFSLVIVFWVQFSGSQTDLAAAQSPQTVYQLSVQDLGSARWAIVNADLGDTVTIVEPGQDGVVRNALLALERSRDDFGLPLDAPYQLVIWDTGRVTLSDLEMDRHIPLDSFRPGRADALADLLRLNGDGR